MYMAYGIVPIWPVVQAAVEPFVVYVGDIANPASGFWLLRCLMAF
jgi:hypothetical protein